MTQTSNSELRNRLITVRFTEDEYQQIVSRATAAGQQQPAVYCRQRLLLHGRARPAILSLTMLSEVRSLRMTLGHLGNALNQIAHQLNQDAAASAGVVNETCELIETVRTEVRNFHAILK
ncbi:MAG: hypothetical protein HC800_13515 [Phormidesmis sp. RL_2_1]|nr:hypothetical protein [Phormidesmis sp. RL_2_1]